MRIAVLEDDISQAELISLWLTDAGYICHHFQTAASFQRNVAHESYDLIILDWELPASSGIDVLKWVREQKGWQLPVLFTTVRDSEADIVTALEAGADDYINKPLVQSVTLARVHALIRRVSGAKAESSVLEVGDFCIDSSTSSVTHKGEQITLTDREFKLVEILFKQLGNIVSRGYILENVWGISADINSRTVDTHISRIRQKLHLTPEHGWKVKAIYQHGYRLEQI